jgi:hypothetical protein
MYTVCEIGKGKNYSKVKLQKEEGYYMGMRRILKF